MQSYKEKFNVQVESYEDIVVALAGNPNTGKSTVFNNLTGLKQHTGNWPGKTVTNAQGKYKYKNDKYILVDLPGTYSLLSNSQDELVARDFICFGSPDATVVVTDATSLERNLNLVLQILEITNKVVVCVNLIDEATRKNIEVKLKKLSDNLGVPVVGTSAREGKGLDELQEMIKKVTKEEIKTNPIKIEYSDELRNSIKKIKSHLENSVSNKLNLDWLSLRLMEDDNDLINSINEYLNIDLSKDDILNEKINTSKENLVNINNNIVSSIIKTAENISKEIVKKPKENHNKFDYKIDDILTSKLFGIPIMIALLGIVFWLTIAGANYPSEMLAKGLFLIEAKLTLLFDYLNVPVFFHDILVLGMYRTLAWVISVMLPPMAIFFPLFTLLEDLGYLPRVAFNLDYYFKKACAHGKQALTMCMGFGCNAAGIIACRIIDSPREKLIAIITNNFVPCNGRFPTLIALATIFIASGSDRFSSLFATLAVLISIILGVFITLIISKILSNTILKGLPSSFTLELPPYRKPQVGKVIVRSIFDRTLFVLGRAVAIAAPAGIVIWIMANINIGNVSILTHSALFLDPFAKLLGMDGYIMMAFILGFPANEIVLPILIMSYLSKGAMIELDSLSQMRDLFINNGWTWLTAVCTMLFSLNHWPCGTTLWTIKKETGSMKWTFISFIIPTLTGIIVTFIVAQGARILCLI